MKKIMIWSMLLLASCYVEVQAQLIADKAVPERRTNREDNNRNRERGNDRYDNRNDDNYCPPGGWGTNRNDNRNRGNRNGWNDNRSNRGRNGTYGRSNRYDNFNRYYVGTRVNNLPRRATVIRLNGNQVWYYQGNYFRRSGRDYIVMHPPKRGNYFNTIPSTAERIDINYQTFYYVDGLFLEYSRRRDRYVIVKAPIGARVSWLPADALEIRKRRQTFFQVGDTRFEALVDRSGYTVFEVVRN